MRARVHATPDPSLAIQPRLFLLTRSIAFSLIMFLCFLWIILFSIVMFAQWEVMDHAERDIILTILAVDSTTLVMLPILLLRPFRPWLDAARFAFLIIIHAGAAFLFSYKSHGFECSAENANQVALCNLIVLSVIISSWLVTALIIGYTCGLAVLFNRLSRVPPTPVADTESLKQTKTFYTV